MIKVSLCDDDSSAIKKYEHLIEIIALTNRIDISISIFTSGQNLLFHLLDTPDFADIVYLDILMGSSNGLDIAAKLRKHGCKAEIIFLTTSEEYVYDAFDIAPVQYLLKDNTTNDKFAQVFLRAVSLVLKKSHDMFVFESGGVSMIIPTCDISFFEIWKRIVEVHYEGGKTIKFYKSLDKMQEELKDKDFIRIHRSYVIHLPYIAKFDKRNVILKTGENLPIGGTYYDSVKQAFSEYAMKSQSLQFIK